MSLREYIERRSIPIPFAGCWLWLLSTGSHGYGQATTETQRVTVAHRVSYEAFRGPIPRGMLVQHSCDSKWCVNPDHLSRLTDIQGFASKATAICNRLVALEELGLVERRRVTGKQNEWREVLP